MSQSARLAGEGRVDWTDPEADVAAAADELEREFARIDEAPPATIEQQALALSYPMVADDPADPLSRVYRHDRFANGTLRIVDGVEVIFPDYDFSNDQWMACVATDFERHDGWFHFWRCGPRRRRRALHALIYNEHWLSAAACARRFFEELTAGDPEVEPRTKRFRRTRAQMGADADAGGDVDDVEDEDEAAAGAVEDEDEEEALPFEAAAEADGESGGDERVPGGDGPGSLEGALSDDEGDDEGERAAAADDDDDGDASDEEVSLAAEQDVVRAARMGRGAPRGPGHWTLLSCGKVTEQVLTASGRIALTGPQKVQCALRAHEVMAGHPDFVRLDMPVGSPGVIPDPRVRFSPRLLCERG